MKKFLIGLLLVVAAGAAALTVVAARYEPTIPPGTRIGIIAVGGLTPTEAAKKLRVWWETAKLQKIKLTNPLLKKNLPGETPGRLGVTIDDEASVAQVPLQDFLQATSSGVTGGGEGLKKYEIKFKVAAADYDGLDRLIRSTVGEPRKARVVLKNGHIVREAEVSGFTLDKRKVGDAVISAIVGDGAAVLPITQARKRIPDDQLAQVNAVIGEYRTHFPAYQSSRNTNIRLAAERLNGSVLAPGEELSFNGTVGRRTVQGGFKSAPVLKNGKHDVGIGGGICQVSTTLYNAVLLANLKITNRHNHSVPSVYVPIGRDATVDYGSLDLAFENNQATPIAVTSEFRNGQIAFRILGKKDPSLTVKIVTANHKAWDRAPKTLPDPTLAAGRHRVIEKGSRGHSIVTYRVIYENGIEVKKELLNRSYYQGMDRLIAVGIRKPKLIVPKTIMPNPSRVNQPAGPPIAGAPGGTGIP